MLENIEKVFEALRVELSCFLLSQGNTTTKSSLSFFDSGVRLLVGDERLVARGGKFLVG